MRFTETPIPGAWIIDIEPHADERGFFARTVCREEFSHYGLNGNMVQQSISWNPRKGTLRGMHFQEPPHDEEKLVRVTRGAVYDAIVDLRRESPAFGRWFGLELDAEDHRQLYIPRGVAHGFQTIADDTEVMYEITTPYQADAARGIRWDDPTLKIAWPLEASRIISDRDSGFPFLDDSI